MQHTVNKLRALNNIIIAQFADQLVSATERKRAGPLPLKARLALRKALWAAVPLLVTYPNHDTLGEIAEILEDIGIPPIEIRATFSYHGYQLRPAPSQRSLFASLTA